MLEILVIDDDQSVLRLWKLSAILNGHRCIGALNGSEGLAIAHIKKPDVILLDIMLPEMDGWEILRRLKLDQATSEIPVIMHTSNTCSEYREKTRALGARGIIAKCNDLEDIIRMLESVVKDPSDTFWCL